MPLTTILFEVGISAHMNLEQSGCKSNILPLLYDILMHRLVVLYILPCNENQSWFKLAFVDIKIKAAKFYSEGTLQVIYEKMLSINKLYKILKGLWELVSYDCESTYHYKWTKTKIIF